MTYTTDLIDQAQSLASKERRRPKQASLRRAVSAAYYALFHLLTTDAALMMLPGGGMEDLRLAFRRAFVHSEMKQACKSFAGGTLPSLLQACIGQGGISNGVQQVAAAFVDLQEARHEADYEFRRRFTKQEALDLIEVADQARVAWQAVRKTPEGRTFLLALLVQKRLAKF